MRSIYDQEMREIQRDSIHMCNLAAETLQDVMDAVRRRDFNVVDRVLEQDYTLRQMRMAINERVMRMIATQHPVAVDLRKLFYLVHTADEMERIGYQAAGIGRAMMREQYGKVPLLDDIFRMSERVGTMLERVLTCSLGEDAEGMKAVLQMDDEVDVMNVRRAFQKNDIKNPLWVAASGAEGLEMLRSGDIPRERRLVLLDLNLPRMNGIEFLRELRADPVLRLTPVVVLTTSDDERDRVNAYDLNVAGYILKPMTFKAFVDAMATLDRYWTLVEYP